MKLNMNLTMAIPTFTGFYESLHTAAIDDEVEQSIAGDSGHFDEDDALAVEAMNAFHYTNEMLCAYAKAYVLRWAEHIQNEAGYDLKAKFSYLQSPSEYNFSTDRIFVKVSEEAVNHMIGTLNPVTWAELVKERLSPRPGFSPFYSNNARSDDWDLSQFRHWGPEKLELLCEAWLRSHGLEDFDQWIIDRMQETGDVHTAVWNNAPEKFVELVNQIDARQAAS